MIYKKEYKEYFSNLNTYWYDDMEANFMFIRHTESCINDILRKRGFVFLNEIYDRLGLLWTIDGQFVGWTDRGTTRISIETEVIHSTCISLKFDVEGVILDYLMDED